jgi:hypothetical protein
VTQPGLAIAIAIHRKHLKAAMNGSFYLITRDKHCQYNIHSQGAFGLLFVSSKNGLKVPQSNLRRLNTTLSTLATMGEVELCVGDRGRWLDQMIAKYHFNDYT